LAKLYSTRLGNSKGGGVWGWGLLVEGDVPEKQKPLPDGCRGGLFVSGERSFTTTLCECLLGMQIMALPEDALMRMRLRTIITLFNMDQF